MVLRVFTCSKSMQFMLFFFFIYSIIQVFYGKYEEIAQFSSELENKETNWLLQFHLSKAKCASEPLEQLNSRYYLKGKAKIKVMTNLSQTTTTKKTVIYINSHHTGKLADFYQFSVEIGIIGIFVFYGLIFILMKWLRLWKRTQLSVDFVSVYLLGSLTDGRASKCSMWYAKQSCKHTAHISTISISSETIAVHKEK